jgi:polar amino acid transport system substrate-binding protein
VSSLTSSGPRVPRDASDSQPPAHPRRHRRAPGGPGLIGPVLACLVGLFATGTAAAGDRPPVLHLCFDDDPNNQPALFTLLDRVSDRLAVRFDIVRVPWARCLFDVQNGDRDGAIGASYLPERDAIGVFPLDPLGKPDPTKRISIEGYYLYTRTDSDVGWDGKQISHLTGSVAVKINASIIAKLKSLGASPIEVNSDWKSLFEMVIDNHAQAATMLSDRGDRILAQNKDIADKIHKIPVPLEEKPYYLMLSHQLSNARQGFANEVWETIESVRDAGEPLK